MTSHSKTGKSKGMRKSRTLKKHSGGSTNIEIFRGTKFSSEPNTDPSYQQVGLIHYSSSSSVNFLRQTATDFGSLFGAKTLDVGPLNVLKKKMLESIAAQTTVNQKINNLRINVENDGNALIFCHMYGTLYEKKFVKEANI